MSRQPARLATVASLLLLVGALGLGCGEEGLLMPGAESSSSQATPAEPDPLPARPGAIPGAEGPGSGVPADGVPPPLVAISSPAPGTAAGEASGSGHIRNAGGAAPASVEERPGTTTQFVFDLVASSGGNKVHITNLGSAGASDDVKFKAKAADISAFAAVGAVAVATGAGELGSQAGWMFHLVVEDFGKKSGNMLEVRLWNPNEAGRSADNPNYHFHGDVIRGRAEVHGLEAAIDLEKATDGEDADDPPGPTLTAGETVGWSYVVTNTGEVPLTDVAVSDDQGVAVSCPRATLDPGESITCTASGTVAEGPYANLGTATGTTPVGGQVTDSDPSHYLGEPPPASIEIEKATNGVDADVPPGPTLTIGTPVTWTYMVTNTGSVALSNVAVSDDQGVAVSCPKTSLAVGESMTCTANGTAEAGQYANIGTAAGDPPSGPAVTDDDPSHYFGQGPPTADDDDYSTVATVIGNVSVNTAQSSGFSVLSNDSPGSGGAPLTITAFDATSANGGDVSVNPDGTFTYDPPAGFEGTDTFEYTIEDAGGLSDDGTVSILVSHVIWFVDNNLAAAGDGRLSSPFDCLVSSTCFTGVAADEAGDDIFLHTGSGIYTGGLTLLNQQRLIGQGASSSLATIAGVTWPADSPTEPATGGSSPVLVTTAAATPGVTLGQDNGLHGFQVGNTTGAGIAGTGFGTVVVREVDVGGDGQALGLTNGTLDAATGFGVLSSANSPGAGISLTGVNGTLGHTAASSISGTAGVAFDVDGGTAAIAYDGDITNAAGRSVEVTGKSGGSIAFGGAIEDDGQGVLLNSNGGATVAFTGGVDLNTGTNDAFTATGGGEVSVANTTVTNRIATTTGVGVKIQNTTIGTAGVSFESVSVNGAANGIVLENTGSSGGGFTVEGTGTPGSGGTVQNATGDGVRLVNTRDVTLKHMVVSGTAPNTDAVDASMVTGLVFDGLSATAAAGAAGGTTYALLGTTITDLTIRNGSVFDGGGGSVPNVDGVRITNLLGTSEFSGSTFRNGKDINVLIENNTTTGAPDVLTITNGTSFANSAGGDHVQVEADGSANLRLQVNNGGGTNVAFSGTGQDALQLEAEGNASLHATISGATISGNLGSAVNLGAVVNGQLTATVNGLTGLASGGTNVLNAISFDNSTIEATFTNNTITPGVGAGIRLIQEGNGTLTARVDGNTVSGTTQANGILAQGRAGTGGNGRLNLSASGNQVAVTGSQALDGIEVTAGSSAGGDTNVVCLNLANNSSTSSTFAGYFLRQRTGSTFQLQDFAGGTAADWVTTTKSNTGTVATSGTFVPAPAACPTP